MIRHSWPTWPKVPYSAPQTAQMSSCSTGSKCSPGCRANLEQDVTRHMPAQTSAGAAQAQLIYCCKIDQSVTGCPAPSAPHVNWLLLTTVMLAAGCRPSLGVPSAQGRVIQGTARHALAVGRVCAYGLPRRQVPEASGAVGRGTDQVRCIHREDAVPHPSAVTCRMHQDESGCTSRPRRGPWFILHPEWTCQSPLRG